jgi:hypothetical protein
LQRAFTRAYRYRRQAVEAGKITNKTDAEDVFSANLAKVGLELGNGLTRSNISENLGQRANTERDSAGNWQNASIGFGMLAAILAVIGFGVAISAVIERPNRPSLSLSCAAAHRPWPTLEASPDHWGGFLVGPPAF